MRTANLFPHRGDLSIYPTVKVMREAFLFGYPHQAEVRIGPLLAAAADADEATRKAMAEMRPTCHAVIVMPRKVLLIRFARRAIGQDVERLERERDLLRQTPELAPVRHWRIEARLVHWDIADGVEELARERGIKMALYRPWWLATHRSATCERRLTASWRGGSTRSGSRNMRLLTLARLNRLPTLPSAGGLRAGYLQALTREQRSARNSKAGRTRWRAHERGRPKRGQS